MHRHTSVIPCTTRPPCIHVVLRMQPMHVNTLAHIFKHMKTCILARSHRTRKLKMLWWWLVRATSAGAPSTLLTSSTTCARHGVCWFRGGFGAVGFRSCITNNEQFRKRISLAKCFCLGFFLFFLAKIPQEESAHIGHLISWINSKYISMLSN